MRKLRSRPTGTFAPKSRKIAVGFPASFYEKTQLAVRQTGTNRSELIRTALERYLSLLEEKKLEASLIAGYTENAASTRQSAEFLMGAERDFI